MTEDPIINSVIEKLKHRSSIGIKKYGVTLDRGDLTEEDWLRHLQEELMDAVNYIEVLLERGGIYERRNADAGQADGDSKHIP